MRYGLIFCLLLFSKCLFAQSLGGNAVFSFASHTNTAQLSALGGINVSNISNDVGLAFQNPALLKSQMHQQFSTSFNSFFAGIKNYSINTAWHLPKQKLNMAVGINYFNYGSITQTDASANIIGTITPNDYIIQVAASKKYKQNFYIGTTLKFISSNYQLYKSNAIAADVALLFVDTNLQASVVIKNLGTQLKKYSSTKQELPFDVQLGITKRLAKAPLQFSITAHHLHTPNIFYNDTTFLITEGDDKFKKSKNTVEKIFAHIILSAQLYLNKKIEITTGYNFLRRQSLNIYNNANGLNGASLGLGLLLKKFQFRYATNFYQQNAFHHIALNLSWGNSVQ